MPAIIYHNPACGTSRNALAILRAGGETPEVIEYLKDPPSRARLAGLFAAAGISPREGMRAKGNETLIADEGLDRPGADPERDAARVLDAMMRHPILINRPLVETGRGAVLARPSERVAEVMADPPESYTKEDGEVVRLSPAKDTGPPGP